MISKKLKNRDLHHLQTVFILKYIPKVKAWMRLE